MSLKFMLLLVFTFIVSALPLVNVLVLPITYLGTMVHEACHAAAALLTGGTVHSVVISTNAAGLTTTSGGINSVISSAGYVGTSIIGACSLWLTVKNYKMAAALLLTIVLMTIPFALSSPFSTALSAAYLIALAACIARPYSNLRYLFMLFVGALLTLNAFSDIGTLLQITSSGSKHLTDAQNMQNYTGIPAIIWGVLWLSISGFFTWKILSNART